MRLAIRFLVVLLAGSATFLVSRILSAQTSQPAFWLQQIERATNKQREGSAGKVRYFAQRSDGSNVRGVTESDFSKVPEEREIVLLPERKRIVVSDASKTISTMYLTDVEEAVFRSRMSTAASSKCAPANFKAAAYLGEDSYTGLLVHKYRAVQASQAVPLAEREVWFAPSLGCFPVKERFEGKDIDGTLKHVFEREAVTISVGDPPDELFRAPSGYTEVAPSVQLSKQFTLEQHQATAEDKNFWAGLDEMYNRSRAFKRQ